MSLLDELAAEHAPSLVVLDSLRSLAPGLDENDSKSAEVTVRPVSRLAQRHDMPVLLLAHAGKNGHEFRGSSAIGAAVELGFTLARHKEDPVRETRREPTCWKSRPAKEPPPRWLSLGEHDGRIVIEQCEAFRPSQGRPRDQRDDAQDRLLAALNGERLFWPDWARAAGFDNPKHTTARRARDELADTGAVLHGQGLWWRASEGSS